MHQTQPIRKFPKAIHQPFIRNQITLTRNDTAPPPYSIRLPNGQNEMVANLKHCSPYGIPTIVMHHNAPDKTHAIPLIKPPKINQQILPNSRIYLFPVLSSMYFMISAFPHGRISCNNLLIAWAFAVVIADNAAGLQMGIDRHRTDIFETSLFQVFTEAV